MQKKYEDIINLQYKPSGKYQRMSIYDRAAQFAPFAALTGHNDAIKESARFTEQRLELSEDELNILSQKLSILQTCLPDCPKLQIVYFKVDSKKNGGEYILKNDVVKQIDVYERLILLGDGTRIEFVNIFDMNGEIFNGLF